MSSPQNGIRTGRQLSGQLATFSAASLARMARTLGLDTPARDRRSLHESLAVMIGTPAHREILVRELSPRDWSLLDLIVVRLGSVSLEAIQSHVGRDTGVSSLEVISNLLAHGCLLGADGESSGGVLGIEPQEIGHWAPYHRFSPAPHVGEWPAAYAPAESPIQAVTAPPMTAPTGFADLQRAVYLVLAEAHRKPIRVKADVALYEADIKRLTLAVSGTAGRSARGHGLVKPPLLWFVLGALVASGVLLVAESGLVPGELAPVLLTWPQHEQARMLLLGWMSSPYNDLAVIPTLRLTYSDGTDRPWFSPGHYNSVGVDDVSRARRFLCEAIAVALRHDPGGWYRIDDLATFAFRQYPDFLFSFRGAYDRPGFATRGGSGPPRQAYAGISRRNGSSVLYREGDWREVEGAFVRQLFVDAFRWLGIVEVAPDSTNAEYVRLTDLGQHLLCGAPLAASQQPSRGPTIAVQPNFEIVVPDAIGSFGLLVQLDEFAERRTVDRAATYSLVQAAFVRALDGKWSLERVVKTLEEASGRPLPQNVAFTLSEWSELHSRSTLRTGATVLEADDAAQLDGWLQDANLAGLLCARLGPLHVLVSDEQVTTVVQRIDPFGTARDVNSPERALRLVPQASRMTEVDYAEKPRGVLQLKSPDTIELKADQAEPYLEYRLCAMATETGRSNRSIAYEISAATVARAVGMGWRGSELIEFLVTASRNEMPLEMRIRLLGWSGSITPSAYEPLIVITLAGGALNWLELQQVPAVAELIAAVPSAALALVFPDKLEQLRAALAVYGLRLKEGAVVLDSSASPTDELCDVLKRHRNDPDAVVDALRAARLLGKIDRVRHYSY